MCIAGRASFVASSRPGWLSPLPSLIPKRRKILLRVSSGSPGPSEDETDRGIARRSIESIDIPDDICLIEGSHSIKYFENLQMDDLRAQIESRRNKIFLLLEEIRRLRVQQKLKRRSLHQTNGDKDESVEYKSIVPIISQSHFLKERNMKQYIGFYLWIVAAVIVFGGLIAPSLEVKMGLGGTSYLEFIQSMHLPEQLAEVDPIVASFCGGAVGALSTLLVIDLNNVKDQQRNM